MTGRMRNLEPCRFTWQGIAIAVTYECEWLIVEEIGYYVAHLTVTAADRSPLPFTDTGFQSVFLAPAEVEVAGGPAAYVLAWLDEAAQSPQWRTREPVSSQLSLF
jgi:hypothetical protein